jgi:hypothetical protein
MFGCIVLGPTTLVRTLQGHYGYRTSNIHVEQKTHVKEMDDQRTPWQWLVHSFCSMCCQPARRLCNFFPIDILRQLRVDGRLIKSLLANRRSSSR